MAKNQRLASIRDQNKLADSLTMDSSQSQISLLRTLLSLPIEQRNSILAEQSTMIAQEFVSNSDEMEWGEEYIENNNWDEE